MKPSCFEDFNRTEFHPHACLNDERTDIDEDKPPKLSIYVPKKTPDDVCAKLKEDVLTEIPLAVTSVDVSAIL